ncbi:MAG TPA: MFS transporter [Anaerolineae bacterium]|nr:MFS transporter [Anaerolineae bacterium]
MTPSTEAITLQNRFKAFFGISLPIIGMIFLARLIIDTGVRMIFPFIPQFAAGLGLSVVGFSWLIFVRGIVGMAGPIFGVWADRYGRRKIMAGGLLCQSLGVAGLTLTWQWWAILPMLLFGLGLTAFLPSQQAYISDQVAYHRRGRALAAVEFSWAVAAILCLPIAGWLIDAFGWRSPFLILSLFSLIGAIIVWRQLPPAEHHAQISLSWLEIQKICFRPNVLAAIGVALLLFVAVTCFASVWSIWLSADFRLDAVRLGLVATGIGIAELGGSGSSSLFIDWLGRRRGSGLGLLLTSLILLLLPLTQSSLYAAVPTLIITGIFLEFAIVSLISLYSEQAPEARGTVFSLILLGGAIGGSIGTPVTAMLWEAYGLWGVCGVAAGCVLAALGLMGRFLRETAGAMRHL